MSAKTVSSAKPLASPPEPAAAELTAVSVSLRDHPLVLALLALAGAIAAVAKFPNSPVPDSLIARIDQAQAALLSAASDLNPAVLPVSGSPASADVVSEDWIRAQFESLDAALKAKFEALDERFQALDARLEAAPPPPPVDPVAQD